MLSQFWKQIAKPAGQGLAVLALLGGALGAVMPANAGAAGTIESGQAKSRAQQSAWQPAGPGIDYQAYFVPSTVKPYVNRVYVARMDRHNPNVILESSLAYGRLSGGFERVTGMARRYDQALNAWNGGGEAAFAGARNRVVVAINGYYYNANGLIRGQVYSGWYAKRHDDGQNGSGFAWRSDGSAFIGGCVYHRKARQVLTFANEDTQLIDQVNRGRGESMLVLYTPQWDSSTLTDDGGTEVLVEMSRPVGIAPLPEMITGTVRTINKKLGNTPIPFDHVVLSASGDAELRLLNHVQEGDVIGISQDIKHYMPDCHFTHPESWDGVYTSVGSQFEFLIDGKIQGFNDLGAVVVAPRTAIAYNDDYMFFIVVDGRDPVNSAGMSIVEVASFAKNTLGATAGIALDGGGSSEMVVNGVIVNNPSDGVPKSASEAETGEDPNWRQQPGQNQPIVYNPFAPFLQETVMPTLTPGATPQATQQPLPSYLPVVVRSPVIVPTPIITPPPPPDPSKVERPVANGLMMVVVEPPLISESFPAGATLLTTQAAELRLGPGENYGPLLAVAPGASLTLVPHRLNGVWAKGWFWWKVNFNGQEGWLPEYALRLQ